MGRWRQGWLCCALFAAFVMAAARCGVAAGIDDPDALIGEPDEGVSVRELRRRTEAQPPATQDRQALAAFHHQRGAAHRRLGNYERAIADLRLALAYSQPRTGRRDSEWGVKWGIQADLGHALEAYGNWVAAIELWREVVRDAAGTNPFRQHWALLRLSSAMSVLGYWTEAEQAFREAEGILPQLAALPGWKTFQYHTLRVQSHFAAEAMERQGDYVAAEAHRRAALENAGKDLALKEKMIERGRRDVSRRSLADALAGAKQQLANNLALQGKLGEAELLARAALDDRLATYAFNSAPVGAALGILGWVRLQQGEARAAERIYRHAVASLEGSGVAPYAKNLASRRAALADALVAQGRWDEAVRVFEARAAALKLDPEQWERGAARHPSWALALIRNGQPAPAAQMVERMIDNQLKRPVPSPWLMARLRGTLAMAYAAQGRNAEALAAFRESISDLVRYDQADASGEQAGYWRVFIKRQILEAYLELLGRLVSAAAVPAGLDAADESFRVADLARGSGVQEAIHAAVARAQLPDRNLAALARREQDALNRTVALNQLLAGLADAPRGRELDRAMAGITQEMEQLSRERAGLQAEIRRRFPQYAELVDPQPPAVADVRRALGPEEAMVSVYVADSQSYAWTMGPGGKVAFRVVPATRVQVDAHVAELRRAVELREGRVAELRPFNLPRAHELYRLFVAPDEALWAGARVVNVVSHGDLGQLPFALLVTAPAEAAASDAAYREAPWLIRKAAIAQLPSASAFLALRRAPAGAASRGPFIGFGDPLFGGKPAAAARFAVRNLGIAAAPDTTLARLDVAARGKPVVGDALPAAMPRAAAFSLLTALPDTAEELKEIAQALRADPGRDVYVERAASERNVKQARLDDRRVVAFATHGIAAGELPGLDQPALALSNPALVGEPAEDGFLTMQEVLGLKLDADWVVLSACNTAAAGGRGAEAVSGLGRAFFYSGAKSLLVSNWAVETSSARLLTTELFRRQAADPALTRAEALRQSMLSLMEKTAVDPATGTAAFSYAHPAFWAPFSLVGDGGR